MTTAAIIAAVCILVAGLFAVIVERTNERDEARAEAERVEALLTELDAECTRLHVELTEAQIAAGVVIPFPTRHHGASIELAALDAEATAYTWPAIARDAFPIQQWGEDADR